MRIPALWKTCGISWFIFGLTSTAIAQTSTVVFSDNFNRAAVSPGGTPQLNYTATAVQTDGQGGDQPGSDGGASIIGGNFLLLTNDAGAGTNTNGLIQVQASTAAFGSPFNSTLGLNANEIIQWAFNAKTNRSNLSEISLSGKYGMAMVLGASSSNFRSADGYAVAFGNTNTPDPARLLSFHNGVFTANSTDLISSASQTANPDTDYMSIRVTYRASTNQWALFTRDDGSAGWADPTTVPDSALIGSVTNSSYSNIPLGNFGFVWSYSTGANNTCQFDSFSVTLKQATSSLVLGDVDDNGVRNGSDIHALLAALADIPAYRSLHPALSVQDANYLLDVSGDGTINNADIQKLLNLLITNGPTGGAAPIPEPPTLALATLATLATFCIVTWNYRRKALLMA
jgi:hypothetical protein